MLAFRLRPPPRLFLSRAYSSPSLFQKPPLARPYLWWIKARYRKDGTRRSILLGILHGTCYVGIVFYAYRQHQSAKEWTFLTKNMSDIVEMQRINRNYRNSTFAEPDEIKTYITEIAKVELIPDVSNVLLLFGERYEALSENVPENREKIREQVREFSGMLVWSERSRKRANHPVETSMTGLVMAVRKSYADLVTVLAETLHTHDTKEAERLLEQANQPLKK